MQGLLPRPVGRPLAAAAEQQVQIHTLRQAGKSLRAIAAATGLSLRAVHTVTSRSKGTDRTSAVKAAR
jgi:hypothetical protein